MPIHDWSRVDAGVFHDFHQRWIIAISSHLNGGLLPDDYYALAEQVVEGPIPDVVTLERRAPEALSADISDAQLAPSGAATLALAEHPPEVRYTELTELDQYVDRATRIAIRHVSGDQVVGYIEIVSPGNKHSESAIEKFCKKLAEAIRGGCHLLIIDLHGPTPRDPQGIHARFWQSQFGEPSAAAVTVDCPLSLVAYRSDLGPTAYFEPTAVGRRLIDMPVFLTPDNYVNVPLEATYQEAWRGVPRRWKSVIEA